MSFSFVMKKTSKSIAAVNEELGTIKKMHIPCGFLRLVHLVTYLFYALSKVFSFFYYTNAVL